MMDKLFIPYTILRLRPRIRTGLKYPLTLNALTEFVREVVIPIIIDEWKENIEYCTTIRDAVDDLNFKQRWKIMLE